MTEGALDGSKWSTCIRTLKKKGILSESSSSDNLELTALGLERVTLLKHSGIEAPSRTYVTSAVSSAPTIVPQFTLDLTKNVGNVDQISREWDLDEDEMEFQETESESWNVPTLSLRERLTGTSKRKIDEAEITSPRVMESTFVEDEPMSLSQPTTDREKRRCNMSRKVPSSTTQTFTLHRSNSTGHSSLTEQSDEMRSLEWEVVVLIDRREKDHAFFQSYFTQSGVRNEVILSTTPVYWSRYASLQLGTISGLRKERPPHLITLIFLMMSPRQMDTLVIAAPTPSLISPKVEKGGNRDYLKKNCKIFIIQSSFWIV